MTHGLTLPKVDHADPTPKYVQAREILIAAIRNGRLPPGTKLPATKEFSELVSVSLITAHKALAGLVEAGWLRREVGRGTYVRDDLDPAALQREALHIGLLLDARVNIDDYYHGPLIAGLRREAQADSRRVEFFFHDRYDLHHKGRRAVGAICFHPPVERQGQVEQLAAERPVVVLGGVLPGSPVVSVDSDNVGGAQRVVQHLLGLGHRRFLLLLGPTQMSNSRDRRDGALGELAARGIAVGGQDVFEARDRGELDAGLRALIGHRLAAADRPTAVMAGGFYLALAVLQIARAAGLEVPRDLSVVGFDDPPTAALLDPPLTTVRQPLAEMAACAYQRIRELVLAGPSAATSCRLPTELVVRGSTGLAPVQVAFALPGVAPLAEPRPGRTASAACAPRATPT